MDATRSKNEIDLLKQDDKMRIDKWRAGYTNMNEDEDEDKDEDEDEDEKASSEGDESTGGE